MHTEIKICGIKNEAEVAIINKYPVNYMGMIFAPSKRQITVEKAIKLRRLLREDIKAVGVFVNESIDFVKEVIELCDLDVVQLHGEETVDYCREIPAKVWKTIQIKDESSLLELEKYKTVADKMLLDTYSEKEKGGTGKSFNWEMVKDLSKTYPIILAGGLNPDNAAEAAKTVNPMILDFNSGLETDLIKDEEKIKKLFNNLKEAFGNE